MCFNLFQRKIRIEVKGPTENELRIVKSSTPGKYAKSPLVFRGGDKKYMRASYSQSAPLMPSVVTATIHDRGGQVVESFVMPNSFLRYKRFVFDLKGPFSFDKIPVTGWLDDFSRFLKVSIPRKIKSQQPENHQSLNGSSSSKFNDTQYVSCTDTYELTQYGSCCSEISDTHLDFCIDMDQCTSLRFQASSVVGSANPQKITKRNNDSCSSEINESYLVSTTDNVLSTSIGSSGSQMLRNSFSDLVDPPNSFTPLISSDSSNSSDAIVDKNVANAGSRSLLNFLKALKGLEGIMDVQAG